MGGNRQETSGNYRFVAYTNPPKPQHCHCLPDGKISNLLHATHGIANVSRSNTEEATRVGFTGVPHILAATVTLAAAVATC